MSRTNPDVTRRVSSSGEFRHNSMFSGLRNKGRAREFWLVRAFLVASFVVVASIVRPFGLPLAPASGSGFLIGVGILGVEWRLRRMAPRALFGAAIGAFAGTLIALLATLIISGTMAPNPTRSFLEFSVFFGLCYLGVMLGIQKGMSLPASALTDGAEPELPSATAAKLLDTSVLIDGRIADVCEARFLDGPLLVPQFVLRELQVIADSGDTLRRQRGRRGLEVLQRIQKLTHIEVRVIEDGTSSSSEVDHQLVEVALRTGAKIVTNDFNLNKVATVQGISVLNVNELANALRPAVLPGEPMRVFILREGKEANQGVAYLDDGTMVVVDGARRLINKTVDMTVTSVHQTPAGKMIFGRLEERTEHHHVGSRHAAAGAGRSHSDAPARPPRHEASDPEFQ